MAQSVKHLTLDFSSVHDLSVREFKAHLQLCADSAEPAWDFLFLSLCTSPALSLSLPLSPSLSLSLYLSLSLSVSQKKTTLKKFFKVKLFLTPAGLSRRANNTNMFKDAELFTQLNFFNYWLF